MKTFENHNWISYDQCITNSEWMITIDVGHGGMYDGKYQTFPRKMCVHKGFTFYEGVFNRQIATILSDQLLIENISHCYTITSNYDVNLQLRAIRANNMARVHPDKKHFLMSIHSNAAPRGQESATGIEVFTSVGDTRADPLAEVFYNELKAMGWKMRKDISDGDLDKESDFYILKKTKVPAVLLELGFYTNYDQAKLLMQEETQHKLVKCLMNAIKTITKPTDDEEQ